jgi:sialic acid synthase SpsE
MTKIISECGLSWVGPDDAKALGLACLAAGAEYVKYQLLTDPYRTARDRGMAPAEAGEWAQKIPRMTHDEWAYVLDAIPREQRMVSVFSPADVLEAVALRVDNIKIGHKEYRLRHLAGQYARHIVITNRPRVTFEAWMETPHAEMHCVEKYPCTDGEAMALILSDVSRGYSDHTGPDTRAARFALDCGVPLLEVHVRPDGPLKYLDDAVSKSLADLAMLCKEAHK